MATGLRITKSSAQSSAASTRGARATRLTRAGRSTSSTNRSQEEVSMSSAQVEAMKEELAKLRRDSAEAKKAAEAKRKIGESLSFFLYTGNATNLFLLGSRKRTTDSRLSQEMEEEIFESSSTSKRPRIDDLPSGADDCDDLDEDEEALANSLPSLPTHSRSNSVRRNRTFVSDDEHEEQGTLSYSCLF